MSAESLGQVGGYLVDYTPPGLLGNFITGGRLREAATGGADEARRARESQDRLEQQRRRELAGQAAARESAAARAATAGSRVGTRRGLVNSVGFGSGTTAPGLGAGTLFGN